MAELSFFYANNSGDRSYYLAAAVYAYAFLMPGQHGTPPKGIDPRLRWAADIYNQALTQAAKSHDGAYVMPMGGTFKLPFGELTVTFNDAGLIWADYRMKDFIPAAERRGARPAQSLSHPGYRRTACRVNRADWGRDHQTGATIFQSG